MLRQEDWQHVISTGDAEVLGNSPTGLIGVDDIIRGACANHSTEFTCLDSSDTRSFFEMTAKVSLLGTLSQSELLFYAGLLSEEEHKLLQSARSIQNSQTIASDATNDGFLQSLAQCCGDLSSHMLALKPLLSFVKRTEVLLSLGGDDRLTIQFDDIKVNKYQSSTIPRPRIINRGSCTCSSVTLEQYHLADVVRRHFVEAVCQRALTAQPAPSLQATHTVMQSVFAAMQAQLMGRLQRVMGLSSDSSEIVLFPSGSDAEFLPVVAGLVRSFALTGGDTERVRVVNYVCAAGEVGSGTANAAGGKHFSVLLPSDETLPKADGYLAGLQPQWVKVVQFKARNGDGAVQHTDKSITDRIRTDLSADASTVAVLHVVVGSKTGLVHPSLDTVAALQGEFGQRLLVVVDACQLRCDLRQVQDFVQRGYMTLITGSKFFTAPPFAGAVVMPSVFAQEIERHLAESSMNAESVVPTGLRSYLTGFEIPPTMPNLQRFLSQDSRWMNLGLHMRWACAVNMMERYAALPADAVAAFSAQWERRVRQLVEAQAPYLRLLPSSDAPGSQVSGIVSVVVSVVDWEAHEERQRAATAFSAFAHLITTPQSKRNSSAEDGIPMRALNFDECKVFHAQLAQESTVAEQAGKGVRCMLGQPVKLGDNGFAVVRIALGADMVVAALEGADKDEQLRRILREDDVVVSKMATLAHRWLVPAAPSDPAVGAMALLDKQLLLARTASAMSTAATTMPTVAKGTTAATVCSVLRQLYPGTTPIPPACVLYDLDAVDATIAALNTAFTSCFPAGIKFQHCLAVKAAPLTHLLHHAVQRGLGLETASLMEMKQALRSGCPPARIVFDSPCKTVEEIDFALRAGVAVNANTYAELDKIAYVVDTLQRQRVRSTSVIGLRVNPMVGAGSIDALSTATGTSKFGVPCKYADQEGAVTPTGRRDLREEILAAYQKYPFLRAIMCHVGSQGMPVASMVEGADCIFALADEIDRRCRAAGEKGPRIVCVDIGGGLSANYDGDEVTPTFLEYAQLLSVACGDSLRAAPHRTIVTEFGKALVAKCGVIATRVEECREFSALAPVEADAPRSLLATVHAGADLMLRTCYCPEKFPHRIVLADECKRLISSAPTSAAASSTDPWTVCSDPTERTAARVTVAGPLCFSGDVIGKNLPLPEPRAGDVCLVLDAGANTLSTFSRHCSRLSPAVFAFRKVSLRVPAVGQLQCAAEEDDEKAAGEVMESWAVACIREQEREEDLLRFWG